MFKMMRLDYSRNLWIMFCKTSVYSSDIRSILISGKLQPNLKNKFADLSIKLNPKERHLDFIDYNENLYL